MNKRYDSSLRKSSVMVSCQANMSCGTIHAVLTTAAEDAVCARCAQILCLWFYQAEECTTVSKLLEKICASYSKGAEATDDALNVRVLTLAHNFPLPGRPDRLVHGGLSE